MPGGVARRGWAVWVAAALAGAAHLALAGRYDFFRNELYYIVCGRHPAFGYGDQPPLVPLPAAASQVFGLSVWLLRVPGALAAGGLVLVTAAIARLLGGDERSALLAAMASAMAPALIALTQIMTTSTFEPLGWTVCAYFVVRAVVRDNRRALVWAGVAAGVSLQAKYGVLLWLAGMATGLAATPQRRLLAMRSCWIGVGPGLAVAAPSMVWQAVHGWPFIAVMTHHAVSHSNFTGTPWRFEIGQAIAMDVLLAPLWIAGLIAPFVIAHMRSVRFLAIAYVLTAALDISLRGKDYYLFPAYPALFAMGAAACARLPRWACGGWMAAAFAASAVALPVVLPILDPPALAAYMDRMHVRPAPDEQAAVGAPLTQVFSDELGWRGLENIVARIYTALPADERARAAIVASNYGEAAAIDVFGSEDHLPPALTGQDQYYFWGPRGYDGSVTIHINGNPERWRPNCASLQVVAQLGVPLVMPYENARPVFICRGLRVPLTKAWPYFKRFQ